MMKTNLFKLNNVIQNYAWGSTTSIQELFGIDNKENQPQAEIWMGSHANGCSKLTETGELLSDFIKRDPLATIGSYTYKRFGELPYLFKVLAANKPLSVQVHPTLNDAKAGFAIENQAGVELTAYSRNYKDANHKPELVYALTFYRAMNGFRPINQMLSIFEQANIAVLADAISLLKANPNNVGLQTFFNTVLNLSGEQKKVALQQLICGGITKARTIDAREAFSMVAEFCEEFSNDIGLMSPLMLNIVELAPGEAMFLSAATPHAYVQGTGLEIMANSDNVLRAGLTPKHIDIEELVSRTQFHSISSAEIKLTPIVNDHKKCYPIPVDDFCFNIINVSDQLQSQYVRGAEILFCIEGEVTIEDEATSINLKAGESVFICNDAEVYRYSGKNAVLARAYN